MRAGIRALAGALLLAGCGSSDPLAFDPITGRFYLLSVDGQHPPLVLDDGSAGGPQVELVGSLFELAADGTFTWPTDLRLTDGSDVTYETETISGTWSGDEAGLLFDPDSAEVAQFGGTIASRRLTLQFGGATFLFEKS